LILESMFFLTNTVARMLHALVALPAAGEC
jgi:hypothetical protein